MLTCDAVYPVCLFGHYSFVVVHLLAMPCYFASLHLLIAAATIHRNIIKRYSSSYMSPSKNDKSYRCQTIIVTLISLYNT